ncbi:MAG TPA: septum site-determining protein MinC [Clostridia bacterium]|nr:septum site-determining protein MinC [Clostridia bacterium]
MKKNPDGVSSKLTSLMQLSPPDGLLPKDRPPEIYPQLYFDAAVPDEEEFVSEPPSLKAKENTPEEPGVEIPPSDNTLLIERTVRSGQSVNFPGHVVVMGDVNPGAEIVAGGHIMVFGSLRGVAHAGALGSKSARVAALCLNPTQLRIAGHITRAPDGDEFKPNQPEIAKINDGSIVIEKYCPGWERGE